MIRLSTGTAINKTRISPSQKTTLYAEFQVITKQYNHYVTVAHDYGYVESVSIVLKDYMTAYQSLYNYLYTSPGIFYDMSTISVVSSSDFTTIYATYNSKLAVLLESLVVKPTDTLTNLQLIATDKKDGTYDVSVSFDVVDGLINATDYILYFKSAMSAPNGFDTQTSNQVSVLRVSGQKTYTLKVENLLAKSEDIALHYRFGLAVAVTRTSGIYLSDEGVYDLDSWRDITFAESNDYTALNYWNLSTGDQRHGNSSSYVKTDVSDKTLEIAGLSIQTYSEDSISDILNNLYNKVYPLGSIYQSTDSTNPGMLFGGSWISLGTSSIGTSTINNWKRTALSYTMWNVIADLKTIITAIQSITNSLLPVTNKVISIEQNANSIIQNASELILDNYYFETEYRVIQAIKAITNAISTINDKATVINNIVTITSTISNQNDQIDELELAYVTAYGTALANQAATLVSTVSNQINGK